MIRSIIFIAMWLMSGLALARTTFQVSGNVKSAGGEALSFANIFLYKSSDSTFYKAAAADTDGKFLIDDVESSSYYLKVSSVGYEDFFTPPFVINKENPAVSFSDISLKESATQLQGVQVTAKKPFIEQHLDKMVLNVENSISASGSTALEILEKAPGVIVDRQNDQIRIRNKSGVVVMIDGKINYMSSEALAQYLGNLPSDQIASIEIITNPSSKYDAAGNSGIINIRLKKNQIYGTNGTVSASAGTGILENSTKDLYRGNTNLTLNHRNARWNLFGNAGTGRNRWYNDNHFWRTLYFENTRTDFDQYTQRIGGGEFYYAKLGADYFLTEHTTIGLQADYNLWNGAMNSKGLTGVDRMTGGETVTTSLIPGSSRTMGNRNFSSNFSIRHKVEEKEISFDLDYSGYRNTSDQVFTNKYYSQAATPDSVTRQWIIQPTNINIYSAKLDFTVPFENKLKLDFGAKTTFVDADNNFTYQDFLESGWQRNLNRSNHFQYKENINALYTSAGYQKGKWSLQAGLRAEHTVSDGNSITLDLRNKRSYLNVFPTGFVNYKLSEDHALKYAYSRRIDRPNYDNLNPFIFYLDPYFYVMGNPGLRPQFTNSNEMTYSYKGEYSATLAYADTRQMINEVIIQDAKTGTNISQNQNIARLKSYSAVFSVPLKINNWWSSQNNFNVFHNRYTDNNLSGNPLNNSGFIFGLNTTHTLTLPDSWSAEVNYWYYSPGIFGVFRQTKAQHSFNPGIQKTFPGKKAKLKLNVNDLFLTSFFQGYVDNGDVNLKISNRWNARRIALTFTYNFGNQNVKSVNRSTASEEAKKRAGGGNG
ncbi:TonB-dependent receptor [Leadbetterella sp. DM7]|uniref:TonB-dependent receptor domain-containing protein n=1 Tax=Leadbetterella sp. DM7 TaxID=3235085 RepID=UPI00349E70A9